MVGLAPVTVALVVVSALLGLGVAALVFFMTRGWLTLDLGWGRSIHPLGPISVRIDAPRDLVFEQVAGPYLGRTPQALRSKLEVLARDGDLVVAAHRTRLRFFRSITVEVVRFEAPDRVTFRHLRGPVPHAVEEFALLEDGRATVLQYRGEIGIDFWVLGRLAGRYWARPNWERAVGRSLEELRAKAEERAAARRRREDRPRGPDGAGR